MFLICHVTSREHILKFHVNLWVETRHVESLLAMFGGYWSSASGDIEHLRCHVTSQTT